ncbi:MAG: glycosyltransferase family 4 protein [Bryobacteraceae bacterium]|jgi:glycosyltransferase involved in cell wall biosynthesis
MVRKPRVLVVHPRLTCIGGGNVMAAWTLEALRSHFEVSFATLEPLDYTALNFSFGTSLREGDIEIRLAPPRYQRILRTMPTQGALLDISVIMRWAQDLDREGCYDVLYGTSNEMDFHRRGVQYVNYPWFYLPRPQIEMSWFHRIPGVLGMYRRSCMALARATRSGLRRNLMLANSQFVVERIKQAHGIGAQIIHPPVPGDFVDLPFDQRRLAVAAVGRVHPTKRWDTAVDIVESVRRRGHNLELTLIGHGDDVAYGRRLEGMAATRPWFRWLRNLSRAQLLVELSQHQYGIHPMWEEHFGIAPAELQRAGCIPFVHNSGGQVEIVGGDNRLTFDSVEDAARKIARVIETPALQAELRGQAAERRNWFTAERFCDSVREIVTEFARNAAVTEPRSAGRAKSVTA